MPAGPPQPGRASPRPRLEQRRARERQDVVHSRGHSRRPASEQSAARPILGACASGSTSPTRSATAWPRPARNLSEAAFHALVIDAYRMGRLTEHEPARCSTSPRATPSTGSRRPTVCRSTTRLRTLPTNGRWRPDCGRTRPRAERRDRRCRRLAAGLSHSDRAHRSPARAFQPDPGFARGAERTPASSGPRARARVGERPSHVGSNARRPSARSPISPADWDPESGTR